MQRKLLSLRQELLLPLIPKERRFWLLNSKPKRKFLLLERNLLKLLKLRKLLLKH